MSRRTKAARRAAFRRHHSRCVVPLVLVEARGDPWAGFAAVMARAAEAFAEWMRAFVEALRRAPFPHAGAR